jgi:hypothetical protein
VTDLTRRLPSLARGAAAPHSADCGQDPASKVTLGPAFLELDLFSVVGHRDASAAPPRPVVHRVAADTALVLHRLDAADAPSESKPQSRMVAGDLHRRYEDTGCVGQATTFGSDW